MSPSSQRPSFLERQPIRRALRRAARNWRERHQHPVNFALHLLGIPLALLVAPLLLLVLPWYWAVAAFVAGYVLQWVGHLIEGNDLGEWAGIKRLLGLPYVGISPRWQSPPSPETSPKR
jgi:hypothetical protein